ncbi:MAG: inositol phosphatase [Alphaproteobacteria bacterium]|nr:inositol phosphatase [Alphaproteobacteria bacterium]
MAGVSIDPDRVEALIAEIAETEIAARFGKLSAEDIHEKSGPADLVTEADEAAERALKKALLGVRPDATFIGEETAAKNPSIVEALGEKGAFWIVDPLDGTRNFVTGAKEFGTIVAFVEGGETRMGWIYAVPEKSSGVAVRGAGARWRGAPIEPKAEPEGNLIALRSLGWAPPSRREQLRALLKQRFDSRPGYCSAYAYLSLARGLVDFKLSSRIHPWDHAAGALLVREAGGKIAFLDSGEDYPPMPSVDRLLLATAPGRDWSAIAASLSG